MRLAESGHGGEETQGCGEKQGLARARDVTLGLASWEEHCEGVPQPELLLCLALFQSRSESAFPCLPSITHLGPREGDSSPFPRDGGFP